MKTRELTIITAAVLIVGSVAISALASEPENWSLCNVELQNINFPVFSGCANVGADDMAHTQELFAAKKLE